MPLAIVVTWWAVSAAGVVSSRLLPSPQDVVLAAVNLAQRGLLLEDLAVSLQRKVTLIAIGAAFPVFSALAGALERLERPVTPADVSVLRVRLAQSWVFLVAAELLHATAGLGFLLIDSSNGGRADRLLVGVVLIVALARFTDVLMAWFERRVRERSVRRLIA